MVIQKDGNGAGKVFMKFDVCFLDTNILVYAVDNSAGVKQSKARTLIAENIRNGTGALSTQVMQ